MTSVTFPILTNDKLFLAKKYFGCEEDKIVTSILLGDQKIKYMNHSNDCLIAIQENGYILLIKNLQKDDEMTSVIFNASDCNFVKVYCNDENEFFGVDSDGQFYYITGEKNSTNVTKVDSPQGDAKVIDVAFGANTYLLYDNNKICQFVINRFTGHVSIIDHVNQYLPKRIPSGITPSRLAIVKTHYYLIDNMGNLYNNDCSSKVAKWKIDHKIHGVVGFYICQFTETLFVVNKVGELCNYARYKTAMQCDSVLKEISGIGNYFIAKSDIGELLISSCLQHDTKFFTFAILPTATTNQ